MRLPLIKHLSNFVIDNDEDYLIETLEVLEHISEHSGVKDEEIDVLGELISNLYGALEVHKDIKAGKSQKEALNAFMERVQGSIDN
ncbi:MAG: hypothetical protein CMP52_06410 [Flavobacteriales bacterium]|nr:hypothetical protein [Candidatus Arcticimaribacter sp.]|tara:strand:+ start:774 stop:1031 length:258 start_codon:yes stop_codon:yes gene_type:complete